MTEFTFYWLDGEREVLSGNDVPDAFRRAGYGAGARFALDFTAVGDNREYIWTGGKWVKQKPTTSEE